MKFVRKWAGRLGKDSSPKEREFLSGFDHLIESKELDGLSADPVSPHENNGTGDYIHNPNRDKNLLVEWSVDDDLRDEAITEVRNVITISEGGNSESDDDEITEGDLPVSVSQL